MIHDFSTQSAPLWLQTPSACVLRLSQANNPHASFVFCPRRYHSPRLTTGVYHAVSVRGSARCALVAKAASSEQPARRAPHLAHYLVLHSHTSYPDRDTPVGVIQLDFLKSFTSGLQCRLRTLPNSARRSKRTPRNSCTHLRGPLHVLGAVQDPSRQCPPPLQRPGPQHHAE